MTVLTVLLELSGLLEDGDQVEGLLVALDESDDSGCCFSCFTGVLLLAINDLLRLLFKDWLLELLELAITFVVSKEACLGLD